MRFRAALTGFIITAGLILQSNAQRDFKMPKGPYLGQNVPGDTPELFAPGIISTENTEHGTVTFSPDGDEAFWAVIFADPFRKKIMFSQIQQGQWTQPQIAPFSLGNNEGNPVFSPDGSKLFFTSWKSLAAGEDPKHHILYSQRKEEGWSHPELIDNVINSISKLWHHSVAANGNFYFMAGERGETIYVSEFKDSKYLKPYEIDLGFPESTPCVAKDESYLIFSSADRPEGFGKIDLYISYRNDDGSWTAGRNLGKNINSDAIDIWPIVSPDGTYLFFTSSRNGNMDIYWVKADFIQELNPKKQL